MDRALEVIVSQAPGTVEWNFDQLKESLAEMMREYEGVAYDEGSMAGAKKDLASLRKLRAEVEERRKEIKARCLEPYAVIEGQAKELTGLIDKPISSISAQVREWEDARKRERREAIMAAMREEFSSLPPEVAEKASAAAYDPRWENATAPKKAWEDAIRAAREKAEADLRVIAELDDDFREDAGRAYLERLDLADALGKASELKRQRDAIIRREQERREALERKEALEREKAQGMGEDRKPSKAPGGDARAKEAAPRGPQPVGTGRAEDARPAEGPGRQAGRPGARRRLLSIVADDSQFARITGYVDHVGASWEEVQG